MLPRGLLVVVLGLALAACAAVPRNTLAQDQRDSLRIEAIDVTFAPDAKVYWPDVEGAGPEEPAARLKYLEQRAAGPIKRALDAEILPTFRGIAPARLKVRIRQIHIQPVALQIVLGGAPYIIRSDMELVDSRTGRTLLAATNFDGLSANFGGVLGAVQDAVSDAPIDRLSKAYAHVLSVWLKTGQKLTSG